MQKNIKDLKGDTIVATDGDITTLSVVALTAPQVCTSAAVT